MKRLPNVHISCCLALCFVVACAGGAAGRKGARDASIAARDTRIAHEECSVEDDATREDINADGKPDRMTVHDGGKPVCRGLDFNFDGVVDVWVYLDGSGNLRRRESDYDRDGRIDEIALYRAGVLAERQRATTLIGKLDTWQYYESGRVARAERDSNGDAYIDQWWEYSKDRSEDCPLIHSDVDGDGRPDPGATVDVCRDQHVPAPRDGSEPERDALDENMSSVPTEVPTESQPEPGQQAPGGAQPEEP